MIDEEAVKKVVKYLTCGGTEMPKNWNRRFKHNRDKMKTGDIYELAEVVRNLALRDGEKGLSTGEKQMYVKAKKILASELMYAKTIGRGMRPGCVAATQRASSHAIAERRRRRPRSPRAAEDALQRCRGRLRSVASGPFSSPPGEGSGSGRTGRRRSRGSAISRCSRSRCGGSTRAGGSTRSSSSRRPGWEEPAILLAEELGASKVSACVAGGETRTDSVRAASPRCRRTRR